MGNTQLCRSCGEVKSIEEFNFDTLLCKECSGPKEKALAAIIKEYDSGNLGMYYLLQTIEISWVEEEIEENLSMHQVMEIYEDAMHWAGTDSYVSEEE